MTTLGDLFDVSLFHEAAEAGYIRIQSHPDHLLLIANYTDKAVYDNVWNDVTRTCRGLIYQASTTRQFKDWEIVARPFPKFWSADQLEGRPELGTIPWHEPYRVFEKVDGSLGILYPLPDGRWAVATRGSFDSAQARHATEIWNERYTHTAPGVTGVTHLFEIIYPTNRIVVDNGDIDDLLYLGSVHIQSGKNFISWRAGKVWNHIREHAYRSSPDELLSQDSKNREGFVLWWPASDFRIKIKFEEYQAAHRLVFGTNTRTIWRALRDGLDIGLLMRDAPMEYQSAVDKYVQDLRHLYVAMESIVEFAYSKVEHMNTRKEQARHLQMYNRMTQAGVFRKLDGKPYDDIVWKAIEPDKAEPLWDLTGEDKCDMIEE